MRIERTYYGEWKEIMRQVIKRREQEPIEAPEQLKAQMKAAIQEEFEQNANSRAYRKPWKKVIFKRLSAGLLSYAKDHTVDILIEDDDVQGIIKMDLGGLVLEDVSSAKYRRLWSRVMRYADTVISFAHEKYGEQMIQYVFIFDFGGQVSEEDD